jgi:predicted ATPase/class 3 adenylate cyclase
VVTRTPPVGTVTFLFTDVEGSTRLWEREPERMRAALAAHDALIESLAARHGGAVVRPRGEGDSRFCVFAKATDAAAAAAAIQTALHERTWPTATPLRVRMALHTGEADLRDGDYYGSAVNRAARLRGIAHGGQTLLSLTTQELVRDALPAEVGLVDLGEHRLKDLARAERVFQLTPSRLPADFPPLRSLDARPHNLPVQPTSLVGREREGDAVRERLLREDVRLLTLTGPGGTGKTRLALQAAADALDHFEDGVWLALLAAVDDPALVLPTIAQALGVKETEGRTTADALKEHLGRKRLLLVLDNFEQVLDAAPAVANLLAACPQLKVLVTSRAVLRLSGEHDFAVPPLALPDPVRLPHGGGLAEGLRQYEAVRLFIERALAAKSDFAVTNENAPAVAEICVRLDGLPLAIELAAARVRVLSPQAMLARLHHRLPLLTGGARDLPARQQTLRAAISWSHDLLDPAERALFRRLAVFAGGWTLEAAEAVCGPPSGDVLDLLASLVEKSLVRQEALEDGEDRFSMLETIREYAAERLEEAGQAEAQRAAHAGHYLAFAKRAAPELRRSAAAVWVGRLERDHDNVRAALRWALGSGEHETALRLAVAVLMFWYTRGYLTEGRRWLDAGMAAGAAVPAELRASALSAMGILAWEQGDLAQAAALYQDALMLQRELGDRAGSARTLGNLAWVALHEGDLERAAPLCEESLALFRAMEDDTGTAIALNRLGSLARQRGDLEAARAAYEESLALRRAAGDPRGVAVVTDNLARLALAQGTYERARALFQESLVSARRLGDREGLTSVLEGLAELAVAMGQHEPAATLLASAGRLRIEIAAPVRPVDRAEHEGLLRAVRDALSAAAHAAAWAKGETMTDEQAAAYALEGIPPAP